MVVIVNNGSLRDYDLFNIFIINSWIALFGSWNIEPQTFTPKSKNAQMYALGVTFALI